MAERPSPPIAAVVLSAGASARFQGEPKALLSVGTETALDRIVRLLISAGSAPIHVVVGAHAEPLARHLSRGPHPRVEVIRHADWEAGRTGSVQTGLRSLPYGVDTFLWPVDHPFVGGATLAALREATARDPLAIWFTPTFERRGGHPVLLRSEAFRWVHELAPSAPLRSLLPRLGPQVARVPVDDPGVVEAVDTPEEYLRAHRAWRERGGV